MTWRPSKGFRAAIAGLLLGAAAAGIYAASRGWRPLRVADYATQVAGVHILHARDMDIGEKLGRTDLRPALSWEDGPYRPGGLVYEDGERLRLVSVMPTDTRERAAENAILRSALEAACGVQTRRVMAECPLSTVLSTITAHEPLVRARCERDGLIYDSLIGLNRDGSNLRNARGNTVPSLAERLAAPDEHVPDGRTPEWYQNALRIRVEALLSPFLDPKAHRHTKIEEIDAHHAHHLDGRLFGTWELVEPGTDWSGVEAWGTNHPHLAVFRYDGGLRVRYFFGAVQKDYPIEGGVVQPAINTR